jgi:hypothetical protein
MAKPAAVTERLSHPGDALPIDGYVQNVYAKKPPWHVGFGGFFIFCTD